MTDAIVAHLRPDQRLLMLDNCEHVLDHVSDLAATLLAACPALQILATSRAPVSIRGEHILALEPLPLPERDFAASLDRLTANAAVALFCERARAVRPAFHVTEANAAAVIEICHRLEGLPLAIELAAVRLRSLSVETLLDHMSDRLQLLRGGQRDLPARQQSLADTIAWSYELLAADDRAFFRHLSVFAGGWTADAAALVNQIPLEEAHERLDHLTDQSLVRPMGEEGARFTMLETIREFGLQRLQEDDADAVHRAHLAWVLGLVEARWPPRMAAPNSFADLQTLDRERANIRDALAWAIQHGHPEQAMRLANALAEYWHLRGDFTEAQAWYRQVLDLADAPPPLRAAALYGAAIHADAQGAPETALSLARESLDLAQQHGDALDELRARLAASGPIYNLCPPAQATANAQEIAALAQRIGNANWLGYAAISPGYDHLRHARYQEAAGAFATAIERFAAVADLWGEMNASYGLALALHTGHDVARLVPLYHRIIALSLEIATPWGVVRGIDGLATLGAQRGYAAQAARLLSAAEVRIERMNYRLNPEGQRLREDTRQLLAGRLDKAALQAAWEAGRLLTLPEAIAEANTLAAMIEAALQSGGDASREQESFAQTRAEPPAPGPTFDLTRREREILSLLCQRLTDPEIAGQLFISLRTVHNHVAHIFDKLGVHSRRDAVALAARYSLA